MLKIKNFKLKKKNGFTIIEALIALFVVAVMVSGILPLFIGSINSNKAASHYSAAYKLADSIIEKERAKPFSEILTRENIQLPDLPEGSYTLVVSENLGNGIKQLDLEVRWNFNRTRNINISTYITEGGIGRW